MKTPFTLIFVVSCGLLFSAEEPRFKPAQDTHPKSVLFPEVQSEARRLNDAILAARMKLDANKVPTRESVDRDFPLEEVRHFGRFVQTVVGERLAVHRFDKLDGQLEYFARTLAAEEDRLSVAPEFFIETPALTEFYYFFTGDRPENTGQLRQPDERIAVPTAAPGNPPTRAETLADLRSAINPYKLNDAAYDAFKTRTRLLELAAEWDDYFEKGRPQTFWDIALTTLIEYPHIRTDHLVGPPPRQWFVLHPNVVIENLDAAPDGDQLGGAVSIEWFGVNWWNLKVPFGISVSSLYSDRPGVDDVGHGITLYFANKYCLGWANHGGDDGFFVSLDALKLIDSKKSKLDGYRDQLRKKLGLPAQD